MTHKFHELSLTTLLKSHTYWAVYNPRFDRFYGWDRVSRAHGWFKQDDYVATTDLRLERISRVLIGKHSHFATFEPKHLDPIMQTADDDTEVYLVPFNHNLIFDFCDCTPLQHVLDE